MDRHVPSPLKQLRQQQAAEAKLLAFQTGQRAGVLREQEKIREADAAEKTANAERLKTPLPAVPNGRAENSWEHKPNLATWQPPAAQETRDTAPKDPTGTSLENPEILPESGKTTDKVNTLKRDVAEISQDYTLSEEGEGDTISGNKELRNEGETEDKNNSKRANGPLHPPPQNERTLSTSYHQQ